MQDFVAHYETIQNKWVWWNLPPPKNYHNSLARLIDETYDHVWFSQKKIDHLLSIMSAVNLAKIKAAQQSGELCIGTVYKRGRPGADGQVRQRAEVRFDGIAGCLRTPRGGSSRQTFLMVKKSQIKARLISPREAARLMGLPEHYLLPEIYNDAYKLAGDGVAVPVVSYLDQNLFMPLMQQNLVLKVA